MKIAIAGHSGLIGKAVEAAAQEAGHSVIRIPRTEVEGHLDRGISLPDAVHRWLDDSSNRADETSDVLAGAEVLINCAGRADPAGKDRLRLFEANALLPGVLAELASRAGVQRMIHVSSSAVQQRMKYLDETPRSKTLTPYAASKATGEQLLMGSRVSRPPELAVYRPTSVQAPDRAITRTLVGLASKKILPLPGAGRARLPLCLLENLAAGICHLTSSKDCPEIVLQPWEGLTTRLLFELWGNRPLLVPVPRLLATGALVPGYLLGRKIPRIGSLCHNLELLAIGKGQNSFALARCGFQPPVGLERYREIADQVRAVRNP